MNNRIPGTRLIDTIMNNRLIDTWYWAGREGVKRPGPGEGVSPVSWRLVIMIIMIVRMVMLVMKIMRMVSWKKLSKVVFVFVLL